MPPGLPIGLYHESPLPGFSTRWPNATPGDLSLFRSLILDQTDAAIIRGMERTMDEINELAYRAGPGHQAPSPPHGPISGEEKRPGHSLPASVETRPDGREPFSSLELSSEDANVGHCEIAASKEVKRMHGLSTPPRRPKSRPSSFGERPVPQGNKNLRQRSNTDTRRKPTFKQATPTVRLDMVPKWNPMNSGGDFSLPIEQISMLLDAETIGRLMVAAGQSTLHSSQQYTMLPEHREGRTPRKAAPYRKDLHHWLGSDVESPPSIMKIPASVRKVAMQGGTQPQWRIPSITHTGTKPAGMHMIRNPTSPFERLMNLEDDPVAEENIVDGKDHPPASKRGGCRATKSIPSIPQDGTFESEHIARLVMLQRRRHDVDRPEFRKSIIEYPDTEELKAIQRDIRARTVQGLVREERRGTWYGYGLGV